MESAPEQKTTESARVTTGTLDQFQGTENPRELRVLLRLLNGAAWREEIDRAAGASNGPALIKALRSRGLDIPCVKYDARDRDGRLCHPGLYRLTEADRYKLSGFLKVAGCGTE